MHYSTKTAKINIAFSIGNSGFDEGFAYEKEDEKSGEMRKIRIILPALEYCENKKREMKRPENIKVYQNALIRLLLQLK